MKRYGFAVVVSALFAAGCPSFVNAPGPAFAGKPAPEGKAAVYFYRPAKKIMSSYPFFMSIPEKANNCFRLESGGYTQYVAEPGNLVVGGIATGYVTKSLDLKAGDVRYVRVEVEDETAVLSDVPAAEAQSEIAATRGIETCSPDEAKKK